MTVYGGGDGGITHVVLTASRIEAEAWIQRKQLPRRAVLIVTHPVHLRGVTVRESARIKRTDSFKAMPADRRELIEKELASRTVA